jgi:hypothetical protein
MGSGYPSLRFYPTVEGCACNEAFAVVGGLGEVDCRRSRSRQTLRSLICLGLKGRQFYDCARQVHSGHLDLV